MEKEEINYKNLGEQESSIPPTGEIETSSGNKFQINFESCAEIETTSIRYFNLIPNFKKPSIFSMATVATVNGKTYYVIDGEHHCEAALNDGKTSLMCRILWVSDTSDAVLAWLKSYVRTGPIDGDTSYAERARNILIMRELLLGEGYLKITPGGTWSSQQLKLNVVSKLASIFKRSKRTIENYIRHFDLLIEAAIERMVREEVPKSFYSAIESAEAKFISSVASLHDETTLRQAVSAQVEEWLDNFDRKVGRVSTLVNSNSNKRNQKNVKNTAPGIDADTNQNNGSVADVMGTEKHTEAMQSPNPGESVGEMFDHDHLSQGSAPDEDDDQEKKPYLTSTSSNFGVPPEGDKLPEDEGDPVYLNLSKLADDLKEVAKRRPPLAELADDIQGALDRLLDLKGAVSEKIQAAPYEALFEEEDAA